jgi:hypothetical protein
MSVLVAVPSGISLETAQNSRQSTTPGMTLTSLRTRETHQDLIVELAKQVLDHYEGGNVMVLHFSLKPTDSQLATNLFSP